jgi:hypothetical protein
VTPADADQAKAARYLRIQAEAARYLRMLEHGASLPARRGLRAHCRRHQEN